MTRYLWVLYWLVAAAYGEKRHGWKRQYRFVQEE